MRVISVGVAGLVALGLSAFSGDVPSADRGADSVERTSARASHHTPGPPTAVATPRERIAGYLLFYYVSDPNNANPAYLPQRLASAALLAGKEDSDFWRDTDIQGLHDLVRSLVQEPVDDASRRFQALVADLLDVRGKRVAVYLIDDAGQALQNGGKVVEDRYDASVDAAGTAVWPSAQDDEALDLSGSVLAGSFSTGEANLSSAEDSRSTFLHELTHVQALSDARPHLFSAGGVDYGYGKDGDHGGFELIPDKSTVYDEAVAGAVEMLFEPHLVDEAMEGLGKNGYMYVEKAAPDAKYRKTSTLDDVWLYDRIKPLGIPELKAKGKKYAAYDVADLPGFLFAHNETAMGVVVAEAARRTTGARGLFRALDRTNLVVKRETDTSADVSRVTVVELAVLLPQLGREILGHSDPEAALVSGGPVLHLFPLAVYDYMTGRYADSEAAFGDLFNGQLDPTWLSVYWQAGRPRLDSALPPTSRVPRSAADLQAIETAFKTDAGAGG
ncbi:MAG: hypothetical protein ABFS14_08725 [Gemmatimonadota bacterium]